MYGGGASCIQHIIWVHVAMFGSVSVYDRLLLILALLVNIMFEHEAVVHPPVTDFTVLKVILF